MMIEVNDDNWSMTKCCLRNRLCVSPSLLDPVDIAADSFLSSFSLATTIIVIVVSQEKRVEMATVTRRE